jgi:hypothetical protein
MEDRTLATFALPLFYVSLGQPRSIWTKAAELSYANVVVSCTWHNAPYPRVCSGGGVSGGGQPREARYLAAVMNRQVWWGW